MDVTDPAVIAKIRKPKHVVRRKFTRSPTGPTGADARHDRRARPRKAGKDKAAPAKGQGLDNSTHE